MRRPHESIGETPASCIQLGELAQHESRVDAAVEEPDVRPSDGPTHEPWSTSTQPPQPGSSLAKCGNQGFLGSTSYSYIFSEGLENLRPASTGPEILNSNEHTASDDQIMHSCHVLSFLEDKTVINRLIERWYEHSEGSCICPEFVMTEWLKQLWKYHEHALTGEDPEAKRILCANVWRTTCSHILIDKNTSVPRWIGGASGDNLRWQVIGLIAVVVGLCAVTLSPSDKFLASNGIVGSKLIKQMMEVSHACIDICRDCDAMDDLFVWLSHEHARFVRAVKGEGSHDAYRAGGEANDALVTMGLHQSTSSHDEIPFFLSELRKRLVVGVYAMEISTAVFLGRPARLSHLFCNINPPLDLRDDQITLEGIELEAALENLNLDGFNKGKHFYRTTWLRVWLPFEQLREEILNLALGRQEREDVLRQSQSIQQRSSEKWAMLPPFIRQTPDEGAKVGMLRPVEVLYRTVFRQDWLSNELLLQRVLIRKTGSSSEKLISTAQAILKDILLITQRYDIAPMLQTDFAFLLLIHGMRSGATLAVELLKQEKMGPCLENMLLPRSRTIQDLSVFAARLGAVDPSSGAFSMCDHGRKAITSILDQILSPDSVWNRNRLHPRQQPPLISPLRRDPGLPTTQTLQDSRLLDLELLPTSDMDQRLEFDELITLGHDYDFMKWLENAEWGPSDS